MYGSPEVMIDAPDCGTSLHAFTSIGQELIDHDPRHNLLLSAHAYWAADPNNLRAARYLGYVLMMSDDYLTARRFYLQMCRVYPDMREGFEQLSLCDIVLHRGREAVLAADRAIQLAQAEGDTATVRRVRDRIQSALGH